MVMKYKIASVCSLEKVHLVAVQEVLNGWQRMARFALIRPTPAVLASSSYLWPFVVSSTYSNGGVNVKKCMVKARTVCFEAGGRKMNGKSIKKIAVKSKKPMNCEIVAPK